MSYIIAHIKINEDKTYSVDIVDDEPSIEEVGLEQTIQSGKNDFYIKIPVDQCINSENDCFGLSDGKSYRLDFDSMNFDNRVPIDAFLANGYADNTRADASPNAGFLNNDPLNNGSLNNDSDAKKGSDNDSLVNGKEQTTLVDFKALIESELSKISPIKSSLDDFKNLIAEKLKEVGQLKQFKQLIVKELENVVKPELNTVAKLDETQEEKPATKPDETQDKTQEANPKKNVDSKLDEKLDETLAKPELKPETKLDETQKANPAETQKANPATKPAETLAKLDKKLETKLDENPATKPEAKSEKNLKTNPLFQESKSKQLNQKPTTPDGINLDEIKIEDGSDLNKTPNIQNKFSGFNIKNFVNRIKTKVDKPEVDKPKVQNSI